MPSERDGLPWFASIRTRIVAALIVLVLGPIIFLGLTIDRAIERDIVQTVKESNLQWLDWVQEDLGQYVFRLEMDVKSASAFPPTRGLLRSRDAGGIDPLDGSTELQWKERLQQLFQSYASTHPDCRQIRYLDEAGQELVRVDSFDGDAIIAGESQLQDKSQRPYFQAAMRCAEGECYISPLSLNMEQGVIEQDNPMLRAAAPVWYEGRPRGVVVINELPSAILSRLGATAEGDLILAASDGTYLYHKDESKRWGTQLGHDASIYTDWPALRQVSGDSNGIIDMGEHVLVWTRARIGHGANESYWLLGREWSRAELSATGRDIRVVIVQTALVCGIVALIVALLTAAAWTRPLRRLTHAAGQIEKGDFSVHLPSHRRDEYGELSRSFNNMAKTLGLQREGLETKARELEEEITLRDRASATVQLLQHIAAGANESKTAGAVLKQALDEICAYTGWPVGHVYMLDDDRHDLIPTEIWSLANEERFEAFREVTERTTFEEGVGLPGRVWKNRAPVWITDVELDDNFPRKDLAESISIRAGFGFPILVGSEVVGVLEFFSEHYAEPDEALLEIMLNAGTQLGRAVEREIAASALRTSEERFRRAIEDSPFPTMIHAEDGEILQINNVWTQITGYEHSEIRTMDRWVLKAYGSMDAQEKSRIDELYEAAGRMDEGEYTLRTKNGDMRIWDFSSAPLGRLADGRRLVISIAKDVTERKEIEQEREELTAELLVMSRQAGMAEVATGVLHNVGNVLNSVNISTALIRDAVRRPDISNLKRATSKLAESVAKGGGLDTDDDSIHTLIEYLCELSAHLNNDQPGLIEEIDTLSKNVGHLKEIISLQQTYAKKSGYTELVDLPGLLSDALSIHSTSLQEADVEIVEEYEPLEAVNVDKQKTLQILINLISNAKDSLRRSSATNRRLGLKTRRNGEGEFHIIIEDNGVGIAPENLTKIFAYGFTTKEDGFGFGLHNSALAAKEMGGSLTVYSGGVGQGAAFTLAIPIEHPSEKLAEH